MIKVKKFIYLVMSLLVVFVLFFNFHLIWEKLKGITTLEREPVIKEANPYMKDTKFNLVWQVNDYTPHNYQDLKNIFYSVINQGWETFTFYCPDDYDTCLSDIAKLSDDETLLSNINNYVHPYNSYATIKTIYDDAGEITFRINYNYTKDEIAKIDKDINNLINSLVTKDMDEREKIKVIHDYVISNTKYDVNKAKNSNNSKYDSARINGLLYEHYAICSGYTDFMAVVLEKLDIPNFKVSGIDHVWNAVYLDNKWLHLDLTWDDPVSSDGRDILDHSYFLITTSKLEKINTEHKEDHQFDKKVYSELDY